MENKSNNYSGYPITYERELPFDKSGSQFVNELPKNMIVQPLWRQFAMRWG